MASLESIVKHMIKLNNHKTNISMPAIIVGTEKLDDGFVDVKPLVNYTNPLTGETIKYPTMRGVSLLFPSTKSSTMSFPVSQGDTVLLVFQTVSINSFINGDTQQHDPDFASYGDLSNVVAMVGFTPYQQSAFNPNNYSNDFNNQDLNIVHNKNSSLESSFSIGTTGDIKTVSPTEIKVDSPVFDVSSDLLNANNAIITTGGDVVVQGQSLNQFMLDAPLNLKGKDGDSGWSPVISVVPRGRDEAVLEVSDWTGGEGDKPSEIGYVSSQGLVSDISKATNIRGAKGSSGASGADLSEDTINDIVNGKLTVENIMDLIQGQIDESALSEALTSKIDKIENNELALKKETQDRVDALTKVNNDLVRESADRIESARQLALGQLELRDDITDVATESSLLAAQVVGDYKGTDLSKLTTGLIFQEREARASDIEGVVSQITLLSAGIGEEYDSIYTWNFDTSKEGWQNGTYNSRGYLNVRGETIISPPLENVIGEKYPKVKLRIQKVGTPIWQGLLTYSSGSKTVEEPKYDSNGWATVDFNIDWIGDINQISLKLASSGDLLNYFSIDWISIGRVAPAASSASLLEEIQIRASETEANAQSFTTLNSQINGGGATPIESSIVKKLETTTNLAETTAQQQDVLKSSYEDEMFGYEGTVQTTARTLASATQAEAEKLDLLSANVLPRYADKTRYASALRSTQWTYAKTVARDNYATNERITNLQSSVADSNAQFIENLNTVATSTSATASRVTTLQTTVAGNTASIETAQDSIDGINLQYTVKLDSGGKISGFGLMNDGATSAFDIRADRFSISAPIGNPNDVNGTSPFMVLTNPQVIDGVTVPAGVYMRQTYIAKASIDLAQIKTASIGNLSALSSNLGAITAGSININNKFIVDAQGNVLAKSGTFEGTVLAEKISGTIDIESMKRSAWTAGYDVYIKSSGTLPAVPSYFSTDDRMYPLSLPSYGSISWFTSSFGQAVRMVMFEMRLNVASPVLVKQFVYNLDDALSIFINGASVKYNSTQLGYFSYTLPAGSGVLVQYILGNGGGGESALSIGGNFIDNINVKFA